MGFESFDSRVSREFRFDSEFPFNDANIYLVGFQNGCNKVAIELRVVQFWSEIILVISNQTE